MYSICLAWTLSVCPVLYRFGLYSIGYTDRVQAQPIEYFPVLHRFGRFSMGLACTLSVWLVLYRFGLYSIRLANTLSVLACSLSVWACTLSVWLVLYRFACSLSVLAFLYWFSLLF